MGTIFETKLCTRCHGTGEYSYCAGYGTRCFKCHGAKVTLTKRGAAARRYWESLCSVPAKELKPGDTIEVTSVTHGGQVFSYIATVTGLEIVPCNASSGTVINGQTVTKVYTEMLSVNCTHAKYGNSSICLYNYDTPYRIHNHANRQANAAKALEYQKTLTKLGTPRKAKQLEIVDDNPTNEPMGQNEP